MNPYNIRGPQPLDLAAIAEYTASVLFAREHYTSDSDREVRERVAQAEKQRRYRDRKAYR